MVFYNASQMTGAIIDGITSNVTGSLFLTLLLIIILLIFISLAMRIPEEATILIVLPLLLVTAAFYKDFLAVTAAALLYVGYLFAKNLLGGVRG